MGLKENVKYRRLALGLTLEALGKQIGVTKPTMQRYESGAVKISSDKVAQLAEKLRTTPATLLGWDISNDTVEDDYTAMIKRLMKLIGYDIIDIENESTVILLDKEKNYKISREDFDKFIKDNVKYLKSQILLLEDEYKD